MFNPHMLLQTFLLAYFCLHSGQLKSTESQLGLSVLGGVLADFMGNLKTKLALAGFFDKGRPKYKGT